MPTPFPGMDSWLERRGIWEQVHTGLIVTVQRFLTPLLRPHYHVGIGGRYTDKTFYGWPMPRGSLGPIAGASSSRRSRSR